MTVSTSTRRPQNLPADLTSFVGREREIAAIRRLLETSRLITLTGAGGVGKSRLAVRAASEAQRRFRDGVWLVELAALNDGTLAVQAVADALRIQGLVVDRSLESLVEYLRPRAVLLVLDNCEHLLEPCGTLASSLLRSCPEVQILTTSRQPLHLDGEHVLTVAPLPVAGDVSPPLLDGERPPALQLFVDRAAAVQPGFVLDSRNVGTVSEICRRLDGIPLAIELAAGRLRMLSVEQLRERLDNRFAVLAGASHTALPRQRTLRALIDWSFDLCSPLEQVLWSRLSVFRDGCELDAAESVCADEQLPVVDVLHALTGLVDKSVVTAEPVEGHMRYVLAETLADYGRERLSETAEESLRRKHQAWCQELVARAEMEWFGDQQVELFGRLRREHANLRVALGTAAHEPDGAAIGLEMASSLRFYWVMGGAMVEGRHWLARFLAHHPAEDSVRLKALVVSAHLATLLSDFTGAKAILDEASRLADRLADLSGRAGVAQIAGLHALFQSDVTRAAELFAEAAEGHRETGDVASLAYDHVQLALATASSGDHDRALALLEDALRICEPTGEDWSTALAWFALSVVTVQSGDYERATAAGQQSIRLRQPLGDRRNIGLNFEVLACSAAGSGDAKRAARLFAAAEAAEKAIGTSSRAVRYLAESHHRYEAVARKALGDAAFEREWNAGAQADFEWAVDYALGVDRRRDGLPEEFPAGAGTPGGLTKREWQIAQLIARGMSNREIASELVISPRTAEGHVEHILAKLSFTSRAQVAAWVARQGTPRG